MRFEDLKGKVLKSIEINKDKTEILFKDSCDNKYLMFQKPECCEVSGLLDIFGDLDILINYPIITTEYAVKNGDTGFGTFTWSFYELATNKGHVTIRWYGVSTGNYSERVSFIKL